MNKFFKITVVAAVTFTATGVFAAPHHGGHHHGGNEGVRLATDIINLVDSALRLLTGAPQTVEIVQPGVTVINNTPPPPPPPPVRTVFINNHRPAPRPQTVIINNNHHPRKPVARPVTKHIQKPRHRR